MMNSSQKEKNRYSRATKRSRKLQNLEKADRNVKATDIKEKRASNEISPINGISPSMIRSAMNPLLVLDVNGILCRRIRRREKGVTNAQFRASIGNVALTDVVPRTDLTKFLSFLDSNFTLAIWSSAKQKTVNKLIQMLFPLEISQRLLFAWGQDKCEMKIREEATTNATIRTAVQRKNAENPACNIIFVKSLAKVFRCFPSWDESNTILMDDSPDKCPDIFRKNALHPPSISGLAITACTCCEGNDEINEQKQIMFFQKLISYYRGQERGKSTETKSKEDCAPDINNLHQFLYENAQGHMGWAG